LIEGRDQVGGKIRQKGLRSDYEQLLAAPSIFGRRRDQTTISSRVQISRAADLR